MKIALFIPSFRGGGAERVMVQLANEFSQRGQEVDLLVASADGPYSREVSSDVNVISLNQKSIARCSFALIRYFRSVKPAVVMSTMSHCNTVVSLAAIASRRRIRVVLREALPLQQEIGGSVLRRLLAKLAYQRADAVIFVSECQKQSFSKLIVLPEHVKQVVVLNSICDREFYVKASEPITTGFPWDDGKPVFIAMGRFTPQKDFQMLVRAFCLVRGSVPCHLALFGEGPLRPELELLARESGYFQDIWMPGFVDNPFPYMKMADVVALSSLAEGMPNVLVQAKALKKTCVATDCECGPSEILQDYDKGFLVKVGDEHGMALALSEAVSVDAHSNSTEQAELEITVDAFVDDYASVLFD